MSPKKANKDGIKKKREPLSVEIKKEIIAKKAAGASTSDLAREYGRPASTISTVFKEKDKILSADVAKGVTVLSRQRSKILEDVEKLLLIWINEKMIVGDRVSEEMICDKARMLHADLSERTPGTSQDDIESFKASRGWCEKFKRRSGIHRVGRHVEAAASSDTEAVEKFVQEFKDFTESEKFMPQQVFNCEETGLFWKRMPKRTYIAEEEMKLLGHKPMNDKLTLLLCANASGDLKIKPLLVYPSVFKQYKVIKSKLNMMWRSNSSAWVTRLLFVEWITETAGPAIKEYLMEKNLPLKAVFLMDHAPAHPTDFEELLPKEFSFITVKFLPPNTTRLLQPLDQQVIANFKKIYTRELFQKCFEVTNATQLTLRDFLKEHFNIYTCVTLIDKSWQGVARRTLNSAWGKLWPECVLDRDFDWFESEPRVTVVEEIVNLGSTMGLEVDWGDVDELVEEHREELTTEELEAIREEQQQTAEEVSVGEEQQEKEEELSSEEIREMCKTWEKLRSVSERYHPDKGLASHAIEMFNDIVMGHYRKVLRRRENQQTIDGFNRNSDPQPGPSGLAKRPKTERSPEYLPDFLMEEHKH
ncbi:diphthine methyltransferase isoform X1 [Clarias gariepinus]|uniref:diphthine methyltransferase isoform X1 n=1 Tax=Clarias gariepinus TaxID=13013 RepID=UPI00234CB297|nr:diphthine methyltransferase isoform X1 [Clarias gariepinus]XP_053336862.1 diphthine methyltransferase isoform X1 [Clarias gariepinus]